MSTSYNKKNLKKKCVGRVYICILTLQEKCYVDILQGFKVYQLLNCVTTLIWKW